MAIDWFTLVAQVLNFVILLFLLKRFLYRPVLDAIEQREQRIRDRMDEARRKEEEAETEGRELRERRAQLEARRTELLEEAREEAETRRKELAEEVLVKTDRLREDWPDLVMADVNMPGLNGYEICEKIKQSADDGGYTAHQSESKSLLRRPQAHGDE